MTRPLLRAHPVVLHLVLLLPSMSRVKLSAIRTLTFYADEWTTARRADPLPQLVCEGAPCDLFTPDVVRCTNAGGSGSEVDWTCKAELPESLRLGRVEVGCEGFSKPGDEYVLKGSCSLNYRLVQLPRSGEGSSSLRTKNWLGDDVASRVFALVWILVLGFIVVGFLRNCFGRAQAGARRLGGGGYPGGGGGGGGGGWFPGAPGGPGDTDPPPPYNPAPGAPKDASAAPDAAPGWRPGFFTGAALGAAGVQGAQFFADRARTGGAGARERYDWDHARRGDHDRDDARTGFRDRGEGPSSAGGAGGGSSSGAGLGAMRSSTGFGGSRVR